MIWVLSAKASVLRDDCVNDRSGLKKNLIHKVLAHISLGCFPLANLIDSRSKLRQSK